MNAKTTPLPCATRWLTITLVVAALTGLTASEARAQQAPAVPATVRLSPDDLERGQYGNQSNFFFLAPGQTGEDKYQSAGFFGQKLRPFISSSPAAVSELNNYKRQKTLFLVDKVLLYGSIITYASQVFGHGDAQYLSTTQQVAIGGAAVSLLGTLFINRNTSGYLKQAVDNYNNDLPTTRRGALWPRLRPAGLGLAATPQGQPVLALQWHL